MAYKKVDEINTRKFIKDRLRRFVESSDLILNITQMRMKYRLLRLVQNIIEKLKALQLGKSLPKMICKVPNRQYIFQFHFRIFEEEYKV